MSGFLLCWHRAGGALDSTAVDRAARRLRGRGPEGERRATVTGAIAVHTAFTDAIGAEDDLPIARAQLLLAADLRLDDQRALRAALRDADHEPPPGATDAALCAAAITAWGEGAAERLTGDFSFAALDIRRCRLVAARGNFGVKPLFVAVTKAFVAVSNDIDALAALPGVDGAPDEAALVEFLRAGVVIEPTRTARRGIRRVPPSTQWSWAPEGDARAARHWDFPVPSPRLGASDAQLLDEFRELLGVAVRDRLRVARASIQLSGGIDSPALAASARAHAAGVALRALTVSHERVVESDERVWAERVARHLALPQEITYADPLGPLRHLDDPSVRTAEPALDPELALWRDRAAWLARQGPVTIDGEDGDALLAPAGSPHAAAVPAMARDVARPGESTARRPDVDHGSGSASDCPARVDAGAAGGGRRNGSRRTWCSGTVLPRPRRPPCTPRDRKRWRRTGRKRGKRSSLPTMPRPPAWRSPS